MIRFGVSKRIKSQTAAPLCKSIRSVKKSGTSSLRQQSLTTLKCPMRLNYSIFPWMNSFRISKLIDIHIILGTTKNLQN